MGTTKERRLIAAFGGGLAVVIGLGLVAAALLDVI
ncbi:hypothetical protein EDF63_0530 [Curtobacterium sp. JUb34]|nr:hypothetical protein EDF63_0530 [Curtobacterium sp. JUb34]